MSYLDPVEPPQSQVSPALLMGAASPLWSYFAAATAGGVAFWWMTRWSRPVNLEAILAATTPPAATPLLEPVEVVIEQVADVAQTSRSVTPAPEPELEPEIELTVAPVVEAAPEPLVESTPEPVIVTEVEPEPAVARMLAAVEDVSEAAPAPRAKPRKFTPETPETEA